MVRGQEGDVREWRLERWRGYPPIAERAKQERRPASRVGSRIQRGARAARAEEQSWKQSMMHRDIESKFSGFVRVCDGRTRLVPAGSIRSAEPMEAGTDAPGG